MTFLLIDTSVYEVITYQCYVYLCIYPVQQVGVVDNNGQTALLKACMQGADKCVELLLAAGAGVYCVIDG